jgi:TetR/AcrR family transcriptional regulator, transcriptional repressor of bet genes
VPGRLKIEHLRRSELIDATIATIAERGFLRTTVREIAERAGCSPAAVLYYFPRKDDLLSVAFREADQRFRSRVQAEIAPLHGAAKLERVVDLCFPGDEEEAVWSVEFDVWAFASRADDAYFREIFEIASSDWLDILTSAVADAVRQGDLAEVSEVRAWAVKFAALIDGFAVHTRVTKHVDKPTARSMLRAEIDSVRSSTRDAIDKGEEEWTGRMTTV